ncbi:HTH domain-containing protein [Natronomonas amylolytica]|uniref:HTH domain-containing protein n=1 Tax=Natronomonas amylolytica TaxID=3108498 RepID=UPI00300A2E0A
MSADDGNRLRLFLRESVQPPIAEQQDRLRSRLERAIDPGRLSVVHHPARLPRDGDGETLEWYERVREWASTTEASLSPFFESRSAYDPDVDDVREMVSLPVLWLVVSDGASVRAAYPHVQEAVVPVSSAIAEFESADASSRANDAAD